MIDLNCIKMLNYSPVIELFVYFILPQGMLDVIIFDLIVPAIVEVMDFAGNFSAIFKIKCLVNLREASFT